MNTTAATTPAPATLSDGGIKLLAKIAKKTKGIVHVPSLREIAPLLGWTITRAFLPRPGFTSAQAEVLDAAITGAGARSYGLDRGQWFRPWEAAGVSVHTDDKDGVAKAVIAALSACGTVLPKKTMPPTRVERAGLLFLRDIAQTKDWEDEVKAQVWTSTEGWLVESNGAVLGVIWPDYLRYKDGRVEESEEADKPGSVWTWAYKAGADVLAQKAIEALGDEATRRRKPEHPQGDDNTGICQICERRQKLRLGYGDEASKLTLVDHGYTHENTGHSSNGWGQHGYLGQRVGSCWGVGYQPWEKDSSRLRWFRDSVVLPGVQRLESYLSRLQSGAVQSISIMERTGYGRSATEAMVEYTPASTTWPRSRSIYSWASLVRREIDQTEWELGKSKAHLARVETRLASWRLAPLYDELHPPTA